MAQNGITTEVPEIEEQQIEEQQNGDIPEVPETNTLVTEEIERTAQKPANNIGALRHHRTSSVEKELKEQEETQSNPKVQVNKELTDDDRPVQPGNPISRADESDANKALVEIFLKKHPVTHEFLSVAQKTPKDKKIKIAIPKAIATKKTPKAITEKQAKAEDRVKQQLVDELLTMKAKEKKPLTKKTLKEAIKRVRARNNAAKKVWEGIDAGNYEKKMSDTLNYHDIYNHLRIQFRHVPGMGFIPRVNDKVYTNKIKTIKGKERKFFHFVNRDHWLRDEVISQDDPIRKTNLNDIIENTKDYIINNVKNGDTKKELQAIINNVKNGDTKKGLQAIINTIEDKDTKKELQSKAQQLQALQDIITTKKIDGEITLNQPGIKEFINKLPAGKANSGIKKILLRALDEAQKDAILNAKLTPSQQKSLYELQKKIVLAAVKGKIAPQEQKEERRLLNEYAQNLSNEDKARHNQNISNSLSRKSLRGGGRLLRILSGISELGGTMGQAVIQMFSHPNSNTSTANPVFEYDHKNETILGPSRYHPIETTKESQENAGLFEAIAPLLKALDTTKYHDITPDKIREDYIDYVNKTKQKPGYNNDHKEEAVIPVLQQIYNCNIEVLYQGTHKKTANTIPLLAEVTDEGIISGYKARTPNEEAKARKGTAPLSTAADTTSHIKQENSGSDKVQEATTKVTEQDSSQPSFNRSYDQDTTPGQAITPNSEIQDPSVQGDEESNKETTTTLADQTSDDESNEKTTTLADQTEETNPVINTTTKDVTPGQTGITKTQEKSQTTTQVTEQKPPQPSFNRSYDQDTTPGQAITPNSEKTIPPKNRRTLLSRFWWKKQKAGEENKKTDNTKDVTPGQTGITKTQEKSQTTTQVTEQKPPQPSFNRSYDKNTTPGQAITPNSEIQDPSVQGDEESNKETTTTLADQTSDDESNEKTTTLADQTKEMDPADNTAKEATTKIATPGQTGITKTQEKSQATTKINPSFQKNLDFDILLAHAIAIHKGENTSSSSFATLKKKGKTNTKEGLFTTVALEMARFNPKYKGLTAKKLQEDCYQYMEDNEGKFQNIDRDKWKESMEASLIDLMVVEHAYNCKINCYFYSDENINVGEVNNEVKKKVCAPPTNPEMELAIAIGKGNKKTIYVSGYLLDKQIREGKELSLSEINDANNTAETKKIQSKKGLYPPQMGLGIVNWTEQNNGVEEEKYIAAAPTPGILGKPTKKKESKITKELFETVASEIIRLNKAKDEDRKKKGLSPKNKLLDLITSKNIIENIKPYEKANRGLFKNPILAIKAIEKQYACTINIENQENQKNDEAPEVGELPGTLPLHSALHLDHTEFNIFIWTDNKGNKRYTSLSPIMEEMLETVASEIKSLDPKHKNKNAKKIKKEIENKLKEKKNPKLLENPLLALGEIEKQYYCRIKPFVINRENQNLEKANGLNPFCDNPSYTFSILFWTDEKGKERCTTPKKAKSEKVFFVDNKKYLENTNIPTPGIWGKFKRKLIPIRRTKLSPIMEEMFETVASEIIRLNKAENKTRQNNGLSPKNKLLDLITSKNIIENIKPYEKANRGLFKNPILAIKAIEKQYACTINIENQENQKNDEALEVGNPLERLLEIHSDLHLDHTKFNIVFWTDEKGNKRCTTPEEKAKSEGIKSNDYDKSPEKAKPESSPIMEETLKTVASEIKRLGPEKYKNKEVNEIKNEIKTKLKLKEKKNPELLKKPISVLRAIVDEYKCRINTFFIDDTDNKLKKSNEFNPVDNDPLFTFSILTWKLKKDYKERCTTLEQAKSEGIKFDDSEGIKSNDYDNNKFKETSNKSTREKANQHQPSTNKRQQKRRLLWRR
ncbi:hypothetical protein [Abyssalbus ytuae]|uniref:Uncharacterized protein n=1 Tax=Abyssalbus ytuae TaxID=2926907 RepID=A0A9E7D413_9FLAO|nr:hypothetical protein [Abyssalbus ytuae]UOB18414.1 hypothetical protein MQE35_03780 [Abyssalbus ytuae]